MERRLSAGASLPAAGTPAPEADAVAPAPPPSPIEAAADLPPASALPDEPGADVAPWPTEADESAFRAGEPPGLAAMAAGPAEAPLPPLGELVARVPAEVRGVLDELFRAKFTAVRRVPRPSLTPVPPP